MDTHPYDAAAPRTGARRQILRWELGHPRTPGHARVGGGLVLTACGAATLALGGGDAKSVRWAAVFWFLAALHLAVGTRQLRVSHPGPP